MVKSAPTTADVNAAAPECAAAAVAVKVAAVVHALGAVLWAIVAAVAGVLTLTRLVCACTRPHHTAARKRAAPPLTAEAVTRANVEVAESLCAP